MRKYSAIVLSSYFAIVGIFAVVYYLVPSILDKPVTLIESFYFSVVTITTLGYGDIAPANTLGMLLVSAEALVGIFLLGFFLVRAAQDIVYEQDRKRINAAKDNLKSQYRNWKEDVVSSMIFLGSAEHSVRAGLSKELLDQDKLQEYFDFNERERWYRFLNNLDPENYYVKEIRGEIEHLQHNVERFLTLVPIDSTAVLDKLTRYTSHLNRLRRYDLNHYDDQKGFAGDIWQALVFWNLMTGKHDDDYLLDAVERI